MSAFIFVLFFCVLSFAQTPPPRPAFPPDDWPQYLDGLYQEYLEKEKSGDQTYNTQYVMAETMDLQNDSSLTDTYTATPSGRRVAAPQRQTGGELISDVQRLLKEKIKTNPLAGTSAYLEELLVPDVQREENVDPEPDRQWKTFVYPLEEPPKFAQTARCLVKTIINKRDTLSVRYRVATLPISIGATQAILRRLNRPDVAGKIKVYELGWARNVNREQIEKVNRFYIKAIHEILASVFPDYVARRHWTEAFVRELYFKAIARRMTTNYDEIREKRTDRLLATLGMDTVSYGAVKYFDKVKGRYQMSFGPMTELEDSTAIMNPFAASGFDFKNWSAPIPILGIEDENFLPRPLVEVAHLFPLRLTLRQENEMLQLLPVGMHPDLSRHVTFYEGRIGEPTKFKVVKRDTLRKFAYQDIISSLTDIFPISRNDLFHFSGQAFYTYNPEDIGVALYGRLGYPLSPLLPPITVGNEKWPMQVNSPKQLQDSLPGVFSLYRNSLESARKRCAEIMFR